MRRRFSFVQLQPHLPFALHTADAIRDMRWQPNDPPLITDGSADRLFDPPARIRPKAASTPPIESIHRLHESEVALLNEVQECQSTPGKLLGDTDYEAQIGANHVCASLVGVESVGPECSLRLRRLLGPSEEGCFAARRLPAFAASALLDPLRQGDFLRRCETREPAHFGEIATHQIIIARFSLPILPGF